MQLRLANYGSDIGASKLICGETVLELSALHLHWLCPYDSDQHGSARSAGT